VSASASGSGGGHPPTRPSNKKGPEDTTASPCFKCGRCGTLTQRAPRDGVVRCYSCHHQERRQERGKRRKQSRSPVRSPSPANRLLVQVEVAFNDKGMPVINFLAPERKAPKKARLVGAGPAAQAAVEPARKPAAKDAVAGSAGPSRAARAAAQANGAVTGPASAPTATTAAAASGAAPKTSAAAGSATADKPLSKVKCCNCNRKGHRKADCPNEKRSKWTGPATEAAVAAPQDGPRVDAEPAPTPTIITQPPKLTTFNFTLSDAMIAQMEVNRGRGRARREAQEAPAPGARTRDATMIAQLEVSRGRARALRQAEAAIAPGSIPIAASPEPRSPVIAVEAAEPAAPSLSDPEDLYEDMEVDSAVESPLQADFEALLNPTQSAAQGGTDWLEVTTSNADISFLQPSFLDRDDDDLE